MAKRKIYLINLWLYSEDVTVDIREYGIKRKGEAISTEEGEKLYTYHLEKPSNGIELEEGAIHVSMLTEDFSNIDKSIQKMIKEARKRVDEEIRHLKNMHKQLNCLETFDKDIILNSIDKGFLQIVKSEEGLSLEPFCKGEKPISLKEYIFNAS